jgi:hypothetical protein
MDPTMRIGGESSVVAVPFFFNGVNGHGRPRSTTTSDFLPIVKEKIGRGGNPPTAGLIVISEYPYICIAPSAARSAAARPA